MRIPRKAPLLKGIIKSPFVVVASAKMLRGGRPERSTSVPFCLAAISSHNFRRASGVPPLLTYIDWRATATFLTRGIFLMPAFGVKLG